MTGDRVSAGRELFGRYAYPPNELGYCGPTDGAAGSGLASHAREFDGAWPYLQLIAAANPREDPLAADVVTAYWVGNGLLEPGMEMMTKPFAMDQLAAQSSESSPGA